jgi:hypothetical protein
MLWITVPVVCKMTMMSTSSMRSKLPMTVMTDVVCFDTRINEVYERHLVTSRIFPLGATDR